MSTAKSPRVDDSSRATLELEAEHGVTLDDMHGSRVDMLHKKVNYKIFIKRILQNAVFTLLCRYSVDKNHSNYK